MKCDCFWCESDRQIWCDVREIARQLKDELEEEMMEIQFQNFEFGYSFVEKKGA